VSTFAGLPAPHVEPTPRWIRVRAGDTWIADSRRAQLLTWYGPGRLPTYFLPSEDVRTDLLAPSPPAPDAPAPRDAADPPGPDDPREAHDITIDGRRLERVAFCIPDPADELSPLRDHWTFAWDGRVQWFEEAAEAHVHARDPHKRVDAIPSERHVRIELNGNLLAESRRPVALFEDPLPPRWYLPPEDVARDRLTPSGHTSRCPYKGTANYFSVGDHDDIAWTYPDPIPECPRIAGLVAFFNECVDLTIDGEPQPRPETPWSR
jgi:uncharacterized protein (DUF427 family)